jgi:hypothetical protein
MLTNTYQDRVTKIFRSYLTDDNDNFEALRDMAYAAIEYEEAHREGDRPRAARLLARYEELTTAFGVDPLA